MIEVSFKRDKVESVVKKMAKKKYTREEQKEKMKQQQKRRKRMREGKRDAIHRIRQTKPKLHLCKVEYDSLCAVLVKRLDGVKHSRHLRVMDDCSLSIELIQILAKTARKHTAESESSNTKHMQRSRPRVVSFLRLRGPEPCSRTRGAPGQPSSWRRCRWLQPCQSLLWQRWRPSRPSHTPSLPRDRVLCMHMTPFWVRRRTFSKVRPCL